MSTCTCTCTHAHARAHAHTGRAERVQEATRVFWGAQIGAALRRMLPLVPRFLVRGFGPEAPQLAPTKLDEDGWLVLELFPGLYEAPSEPPPTLTLLENSGLHDDYWPSDGGCVSFNGRHLSEAALRARKAAGELEGVGLGCLWRETVELLRETGRPVFATSYQSHEHLSALENLLAIGTRITHAYPNGFREASTRVPTTDLLEPPGPVAEAMRDSYPRPWGAKEAQLATTAALWRFKVEKGGYERSVCGRRNSHVIGFQGCAPPGCDPPAREATAERDGAYAAMWRHANSAREVQRALQSRLCAASELASMPPRQAEIVRATWRCAAPAKLDWARLGEPVPAAEPKAEVQALLERAVELSAEESEGAAEATEEAFRAAAEADPADARPPLNLGRFLAKLSRPAEAIEQVWLLCRPLPTHTPPPPSRTRAGQGVPHPNSHPDPNPHPDPGPDPGPDSPPAVRGLRHRRRVLRRSGAGRRHGARAAGPAARGHRQLRGREPPRAGQRAAARRDRADGGQGGGRREGHRRRRQRGGRRVRHTVPGCGRCLGHCGLRGDVGHRLRRDAAAARLHGREHGGRAVPPLVRRVRRGVRHPSKAV